MARTRSFAPPYQQSWMDSLFDWVERRRIPVGLFYILIYLLLISSQHVTLWLDGTLEIGQIAVIVVIQNIWFVFIGAMWHYARLAASDAIRRFRPALKVSNLEFEDIAYRFIRLPARTGWLITAIGFAALVVILPIFKNYYGPLFFSPYTKFTTLFVAILVLPFNFGSFYSILRMLTSIDRVYARVKRINLFNLAPLYSLSAFTSRVGIMFLGFLLVNLVTPYLVQTVDAAVTSFYTVFNMVFAVLIFVVPLQGIHSRLAAAKEVAIQANNDLIEMGFARMQALVRAGKHDAVPRLRASNSALLEYRQELNKISTWPWDTATLRTFLTALAVPMTVWIVQQVLLRTVVK